MAPVYRLIKRPKNPPHIETLCHIEKDNVFSTRSLRKIKEHKSALTGWYGHINDYIIVIEIEELAGISGVETKGVS